MSPAAASRVSPAARPRAALVDESTGQRSRSRLEGASRGQTGCRNPQKEELMPKVPQPVTDDSVRVRQVNHYQFSWVAGEPGEGRHVHAADRVGPGAWEEIVTVTAEDADVLQDLLAQAAVVFTSTSGG